MLLSSNSDDGIGQFVRRKDVICYKSGHFPITCKPIGIRTQLATSPDQFIYTAVSLTVKNKFSCLIILIAACQVLEVNSKIKAKTSQLAEIEMVSQLLA